MRRRTPSLPARQPVSIDRAHFLHRVLQEAYVDALAAQWRHRALVFEWAAPRPDDYTGRASRQQLDQQARRCAETAAACRARADFIDLNPASAHEQLDQTLADVATGAAA